MATPLPDTPAAPARRKRHPALRVAVKVLKRVVPLAVGVWLGVTYPAVGWVLLAFAACGLLDAARNTQRTFATFDRYFAGNGVFTWLLAPFNLLMDALCLPYRNRGVYTLDDLPPGHREEVRALVAAAHRRNLVGLLEEKLGGAKRGMIFFKWYGRDMPTSVDVPEYHAEYRYVRTIGVSIFNRRQSTGRHFGPLRVTLRVLYNINPVDSPEVYIEVGDRVHRWRDDPLFIFDDTLQHQSVNQADAVRYCLFVDILRPSPWPRLMAGVLAAIRLFIAPFRTVFYGHWSFLR